jgi:cardiolipin synthase A/B
MMQQPILSYPDGLDSPQFRREFAAILDAPLIAGNRIHNLENGKEILPAMLEAIRAAERSITFETYVYWSGTVGREFAYAFAERARAGVQVHAIIDWFGSQDIDPALIDIMTDAGVAVVRYHPVAWTVPTPWRLNNRTHRKLLIIDGRIGFTGGVGIADPWAGDAQDPEHWRDSHYRCEGPLVAALQSVFLDNWVQTTGRLLQGDAYFPPLQAVGDSAAQVFSSSPRGGGDSMLLMYLMLIAAAQRSIDLASAYFVPDTPAITALVDAMRRGVQVRIIVPGPHIDFKVVRRASRANWRELLEAGALIHEFQPTTHHRKALVVDRAVLSIGSTNFDQRSFWLNDEASVNVFDHGIAARAAEVFEQDLARSRRITLQMWQQRPRREKLLERTASILSPIL